MSRLLPLALGVLVVVTFALAACRAGEPMPPLLQAIARPPAQPAPAQEPPQSAAEPSGAGQASGEVQTQAAPAPPPDEPATSQPAVPATLQQLTTGGCCVQPYFSTDSAAVRFIDKPSPDAPAGIYQVDLAGPLPAEPGLVSTIIGFRSPDQRLVAIPSGDLLEILDEATGERWTVDTDGSSVSISPGNSHLIWSISQGEGPFDERRTELWMANIDGSERRPIYSGTSTSFLGWFPDGQRILINGRETGTGQVRTLFVYDLVSGASTEIVTQKGIRSASISPDGRWVVYFAASADDPATSGLWIAASDGSQRLPAEAPRFGAFRWRADGTLLYVPVREDPAAGMEVWSIDPASGAASLLVDPAVTRFSIANGDWTVSPDGRHIAFVSSDDGNLWLLTLPES